MPLEERRSEKTAFMVFRADRYTIFKPIWFSLHLGCVDH